MTPAATTPSGAGRGDERSDHRLIAVMDVGSRALRLGIGEVIEDQPLRRLETLDAPVAIGVDTFSRGRIRATTTEAVVRTLEDFGNVLRDYGLKTGDVRAVATSAVRDATNREVFLDRVEKRTGFQIEIVDAIEETRIAHQLVRHLIGPELDQGVVMLLAFGGGGTQLIVQKDAEIELAESRQFGILKLQEGPIEPALRAARRFLPKVVRSIARVHDLSKVEHIVVVSTDVFRLAEGLGRVRERPWGLELTRRAYTQLEATESALTIQQIAEQASLERGAAELACMAFEELRAFAAPCRFRRLLLPRCSMLDSVMLDKALSLGGGGPVGPPRNLPDTVESSAWAVARKYRISESHVRQVRALALQLFDVLQPLTGLGERSRLLLSVAAILHDIGIFVGTHEHERHSAYLIRNSEVMGLDSAELRRVALMVRHHRQPFRDIDSRDLGPLSSPERVEVLKLTALLRIADALDTNHFRRAVRLRVETRNDELQVVIETRAGDREGFLDLQRAFADKADLAEEVFGMKLKLIEVLAE